jgi:sensor histidine kinase YesM
MEFDHVTNRYLYPDRYIKMIPYFLIIKIEMDILYVWLYRFIFWYKTYPTNAMTNTMKMIGRMI